MILTPLQMLLRGAQKSYRSVNYHAQGAIVFLTYRCSSRCKACNIWQRPVNPQDELTWNQWKPVFQKLAKNGVNSVELFGGDALLRKELLIEMIRFCRDHGMRTFFPTNSSSLTETTANDLVEAGLSTIYFSLDELPDGSEDVRGVKRHAERVVKSIGRMRKARSESAVPNITCITTVSRMNYRGLFDFVRLAREAGADCHQLRGITEFTKASVGSSAVNGILPEPYFMPTDAASHGLDRPQAQQLIDMLESLWIRRKEFLPMTIEMTNMQGLKAEDLAELRYPKHGCHFCTTQLVLSPYGDVVPCPYYNNYHLGNLQDQEVDELWGNSFHKSFCKQQRRGDIDICRFCSIKPYHKGIREAWRELIWLTRRKMARPRGAEQGR